jgi:hypothetical protein
MVRTVRLPTTTASANAAIDFAVAASLTPNPTPIGRLVCFRMSATRAFTSSTSKFAAPVTPFSET